MAFARVQAVQRGFYAKTFRDVGDVFDIAVAGDLSDSTVNQVPVGNPDYPLFGWMLVVPGTTPLYSYALSNQGQSTLVQGTYSKNSVGVTNLTIRRTVV